MKIHSIKCIVLREYRHKTNFDIDVKRSEEEPELQTVARHTTWYSPHLEKKLSKMVPILFAIIK